MPSSAYVNVYASGSPDTWVPLPPRISQIDSVSGFKRGDVVWVNLDPTVGGEIKKRRPCIVVSLSVLNEKRLTVVVVPLSTGSTPRPPLVVAAPSAGPGSNARIDQIRAVDKSRILDATGKLNRADMEQVEQGLRTVLGL